MTTAGNSVNEVSGHQQDVKEDRCLVFHSVDDVKVYLTTASFQQQQQPSDEVGLLNDVVLPFLRSQQHPRDINSLLVYVEDTFVNLTKANRARLLYNAALALLCLGHPNEGRAILLPVIQQTLLNEKKEQSHKPKQEFHDGTTSILDCLHCEIGFLFLECVIHARSRQNIGACSSKRQIIDDDPKIVHGIFKWIHSHFKTIEKSLAVETSASSIAVAQSPLLTATSTNFTESHLNELKFRLHLCKSRILFLQENTSDNQRQSKKEMKSAMEIFQHKIRRTTTSSIHEPDNIPIPVTKEDKLHQIALYLKANSEHLKGNAKKALRLCAEAKHQNNQPLDSTALHFNNLGILHQNSGKVHIALHYFSKALSVLYQIGQREYSNFLEDEVNSCFFLPPTLEFLYNTSLCAFLAKQWINSYECMAKCVSASPNLYALRPKCWLRMAEACIALHRQNRIKKSKKDIGCNFVIDEANLTLIVDKSSNQKSRSLNNSDRSYLCEELASNLGSAEDINETSERPLYRALYCLQRSLQVLDQCEDKSVGGKDTSNEYGPSCQKCLEAILVDMAYVYLELQDPCSSLNASLRLLEHPLPVMLGAADPDEKDKRNLVRYCSLRRRVVARFYACESLCLLGYPVDALKIIGEGTDKESTESYEYLVGAYNPTESDEISDLLSSYSKVRNATNNHFLTSAVSRSAAHSHIGSEKNLLIANELASDSLDADESSAFGFDYYINDDDEAKDEPSRAFLYCLLRKGDILGALKFLGRHWETKI